MNHDPSILATKRFILYYPIFPFLLHVFWGRLVSLLKHTCQLCAMHLEGIEGARAAHANQERQVNTPENKEGAVSLIGSRARIHARLFYQIIKF